MNWVLLANSLWVASIATLGAVCVGCAAAVFARTLPVAWRRRWFVAGALILALPPFLVTNAWLDVAGTTSALGSWIKLYSVAGVVWILICLMWPISMLFCSAALSGVSAGQLECEPDLRQLSMIRWLLWPMVRGWVLASAAVIFVLSANQFSVPTVFQIRVLPAEVWTRFSTELNAVDALVAGWPLAAVALFVVAALPLRVLRWRRAETPATPELFRRQLGRGGVVAAGSIGVLAMGASLALPLTTLVFSGQTWAAAGPAARAGSLAVLYSFGSAAGAASVLVGLAVVVDFLMRGSSVGERWARRFGWLSRLLWVPLVLPGIFLGIVLIEGLNRPSLDWLSGSSGILVMALAVRYAGPALAGSLMAARGVSRELADQAALDGGGLGHRIRHVYGPQAGVALMLTWYLIYLLCLWDVETIILILPPGVETLATRIFNLLHYGHNAQVEALCLVLLALAALPALVIGLWWWRARPAALVDSVRFRTGASLALCLAVVPVLSGCAPRPAESGSALVSRFFSEVRILGSRGTGVGQFNKPRSVALDRDDNLFVVDMTGRVQKFSPDGQYLLSWQMPETDLGKPKGMARDPRGNVVVIEPHYQRVNHFSPQGLLIEQWGEAGIEPGKLVLPRAIAINSLGDMLVSDYTKLDRVQAFGFGAKQFKFSFGNSGAGPGQLNRVEGIGVDSQDRIYLADSCNHRIQVMSKDGLFLRSYGSAGSGRGEFSYPYDIRIDGDGNQFVCEFGNSRIQILNGDDRTIEILGGPGGAPGRFSNPWSIVLDSKGNLYVADAGNHRVQKFVRRHGH